MNAVIQKISIPIWVLPFVFVPLIYSSQIYDGALLPKLLILQIFSLPIWAIWAYRTFTHRATSLSVPIALPLLGFALWHIMSIFHAANPIETTLQVSHQISLLMLPFLVIATLTGEQIHRTVATLIWVGLPISIIGIAQYHGWGFSHIPSNANPSATFYHRNAAAEYLIAILPLICVCLHQSQSRKMAITHGALLMLVGTFLLYTRTRGAWVGLFVAGIITAWAAYQTRSLQNRTNKNFSTKVAVAAVITTFILGSLPDHMVRPGMQKFDEKKSDVLSAITSIPTEQGHRGRLDMWRNTLPMITDHPFWGVGLGNWQYQYPAYAQGEQLDVKAAPISPHNDLVWITAEMGLPGLAWYLVLLIITGRLVWDLLKVPNVQTRTLTLGMVALVIAYLVDGLFNFPREGIAPSLCFYFSIGAISRLHFEHKPAPKKLSHPLNTVATCLVGIICLTALSITWKRYIYDQYHLRVYLSERQENWPEVITAAQHALMWGDLRANTYIALGRAYYHQRDLLSAQKAYENGLRLHPNSLNAYNNLGIIFRQRNEPQQAIKAFQKALEIFPGFHHAANNLGNVYRDLGQWDQAISAYQQAMQLPDEPQIPYNLGRAYLQKGDPANAQVHFLLALKRNPNFQPARQALVALGVTVEPVVK